MASETTGWRAELRQLAKLGNTDQFPLLVYGVNPPSAAKWPSGLAEPSDVVREFYGICDGGYLGGHHHWFSLEELLSQNQYWWDLLFEYPRPRNSPIDPLHHVILAYDTCGFPLVWDKRTDKIAIFYFKDSDDLYPTGLTIDELLSEIFSPGYPDEMWSEALAQLRDLAD